MRLLLDTHTLVWWLTDNPRLSRSAAQAIADPDNSVWVSAASGWEISTKVRKGNWPVAGQLMGNLESVLEANSIDVLPVLMRQALKAGSIESEHPDPFDRMIAAQVLDTADMTLVSIDPAFQSLGVRALW